MKNIKVKLDESLKDCNFNDQQGEKLFGLDALNHSFSV